MDIASALADERRALADRLETLTPAQWRVRTLCPAWDLHGMVAHLTVPCDFSTAELLTTMLRARGNPARLSVLMAARRAELPSYELVRVLRDRAGSRLAPPVIGLVGPWTDVLVHQQDLLIPLGLTDDRPPARWAPALDFLVSAKARIGFLPGRAPALRYVATDLDWSRGSGPEVAGPGAALGLALLGRTPRLGELTGSGAAVLRTWAAG